MIFQEPRRTKESRKNQGRTKEEKGKNQGRTKEEPSNELHDLEESASHPLPLLEGAPQVFFCDVLRIILSDFDEGLK